MEEEFYKFVSPAEIAKDLNLPKELATKIHKYWALKRKVLNPCHDFIWSVFTRSHFTCNQDKFSVTGHLALSDLAPSLLAHSHLAPRAS